MRNGVSADEINIKNFFSEKTMLEKTLLPANIFTAMR